MADREGDLVRGIRMMDAQGWSDEAKLGSFLAIFHPEIEDPHKVARENAREREK